MAKYKLYTCLMLSESELGVESNPKFKRIDNNEQVPGFITSFEGNNADEIKAGISAAVAEILKNVPAAKLVVTAKLGSVEK